MSSEVRIAFKKKKVSYEDISDRFQTLKDRIASAYNPKGIAETKIKKYIKCGWLKDITKKNGNWVMEEGIKLNKYASAEVESILTIKESSQEFTNVYLLATDTVLSRLVD